MTDILTGGCLCGAVTYRVENRFEQFLFCHCQQCRKITGSIHASNLFTDPDNIDWVSGKESLITYDQDNSNFRKVFCRTCGSGLPYQSRRIERLVVPAGSLNESPALNPQANIFWDERAPWGEAGKEAPCSARFPL